MKKIFQVFVVAVVMALGVTSCKQKSEAPAPADQAEAEQVETKQPTAEEIVAKAKAEGANWSVDEWKDNTRSLMIALSPTLKKFADILTAIDENPEKAAEILLKSKELDEEFKPLDKLMGEFEKIAKSTANGKAVLDDEAWGDSLKAELGLPEDM